jgi:hypothetical protein
LKLTGDLWIARFARFYELACSLTWALAGNTHLSLLYHAPHSVSATKVRELAHFELFASLANAFGAIRRLQPEPPEPDIVAGAIGVELTELFPLGPPARGRDAERASILASAQRIYNDVGGPPVHVFVSWSAQEHYSSRTHVATELAGLVRQHLPAGDGVHWVGDGDARLSPTLPIVQLGIGLASSLAAADWRDGDMHEVPACDFDFIQHRLDEEDAKIDRYVVAYQACWLVFILGAAGPSTWSFVPKGIDAHAFSSRFDRAFLFEFDRRRYTELLISRDSASSHMPANERCN